MKLKGKIAEVPPRPLSAVFRSFNELDTQRCVYYRTRACPWRTRLPPGNGRLPKRNSPQDFIFIPAEVGHWEISRFALSARLENILGWRGCRVLRDLHGLRLSDLMHWRNCGKTTIRELVRLVRNLQEGRWENWRDPHAAGPEDYYEI